MNWKYNSVPRLWPHKLSTFEFRIMKGDSTNCFPFPSLPPVSPCPLYCNTVVYGNEGKERKETNVWLCSISVLVLSPGTCRGEINSVLFTATINL